MCFELCTDHHRVSSLLVFHSPNLKCGNQDVSTCMWETLCVCSGLQLGVFSVLGGSLLPPGLWAVPMGLQHWAAAASPSARRAPALTTWADAFSLRTLICFSSWLLVLSCKVVTWGDRNSLSCGHRELVWAYLVIVAIKKNYNYWNTH